MAGRAGVSSALKSTLAKELRKKGHDPSPFEPLPALNRELQDGIKRAFDPKGLLNVGRQYQGF